ncbi:hypothetical protein TNCV_2689551 [Trichonephila clavipes]|uniref:Uncharacterized protein n=1 Tax=Trichonephila clavipes TaxID=2585209 RepID=A0A8X6VYH2_TRICX|nr:hypothetical protein TNCV_2689551 [Trichonephila clavipes]
MMQQPMRTRAYCALPSIRDHWALRCMRCFDQVVSLKQDPQCLNPQTILVLIYRPTAVGMKGGVNLVQPGNRSRTSGVEVRYATTRLNINIAV